MTPGQLRAAGWVPMVDVVRDTTRFPDDLRCWMLGDHGVLSDPSRVAIFRQCYTQHAWWGRTSWAMPAVLPPTEPLHPSTPIICGEVLPSRYRSREEREAEWRARR